MSTLIIDNYDSFTFNLYHLLREAAPQGETLVIEKNDRLTPEEILCHDRVVASPGPGIPSEAGGLLTAIRTADGRLPFLGVCLGHQALAQYFGAELQQLPHPVHGGTEKVSLLNRNTLFDGLKSETTVARYHSWTVSRQGLPDCLQVTAENADGLIMALQHRDQPLYGVQFHPESFMTPDGLQMMKNFYRI